MSSGVGGRGRHRRDQDRDPRVRPGRHRACAIRCAHRRGVAGPRRGCDRGARRGGTRRRQHRGRRCRGARGRRAGPRRPGARPRDPRRQPALARLAAGPAPRGPTRHSDRTRERCPGSGAGPPSAPRVRIRRVAGAPGDRDRHLRGRRPRRRAAPGRQRARGRDRARDRRAGRIAVRLRQSRLFRDRRRRPGDPVPDARRLGRPRQRPGCKPAAASAAAPAGSSPAPRPPSPPPRPATRLPARSSNPPAGRSPGAFTCSRSRTTSSGS